MLAFITEIVDNILHLDVHYVWFMFVQRCEPPGGLLHKLFIIRIFLATCLVLFVLPASKI